MEEELDDAVADHEYRQMMPWARARLGGATPTFSSVESHDGLETIS
jgi:hypothetical protein